MTLASIQTKRRPGRGRALRCANETDVRKKKDKKYNKIETKERSKKRKPCSRKGLHARLLWLRVLRIMHEIVACELWPTLKRSRLLEGRCGLPTNFRACLSTLNKSAVHSGSKIGKAFCSNTQPRVRAQHDDPSKKKKTNKQKLTSQRSCGDGDDWAAKEQPRSRNAQLLVQLSVVLRLDQVCMLRNQIKITSYKQKKGFFQKKRARTHAHTYRCCRRRTCHTCRSWCSQCSGALGALVALGAFVSDANSPFDAVRVMAVKKRRRCCSRMPGLCLTMRSSSLWPALRAARPLPAAPSETSHKPPTRTRFFSSALTNVYVAARAAVHALEVRHSGRPVLVAAACSRLEDGATGTGSRMVGATHDKQRIRKVGTLKKQASRFWG